MKDLRSGKGGVLGTQGSGKTRRRRCLGREGGGKTRRRRCLTARRGAANRPTAARRPPHRRRLCPPPQAASTNCALVFCKSWCADWEFRVTYRPQHSPRRPPPAVAPQRYCFERILARVSKNGRTKGRHKSSLCLGSSCITAAKARVDSLQQIASCRAAPPRDQRDDATLSTLPACHLFHSRAAAPRRPGLPRPARPDLTTTRGFQGQRVGG